MIEDVFVREIQLMGECPSGYPFDLPAVQTLDKLDLSQPVTVFFGENGTGKSTVLEALAVRTGLNAEGGSKHARFQTRASHSVLHQHVRVVRGSRRERTAWFLRAESYFNVATYLESLTGPSLQPYGGRSPHEMSHGESFLALVMNRFGPDGLYFLDEPEAPLSPMRQLALATRCNELARQGSQLVLATHSPMLAAIPDAAIYEFTDGGIRPRRWEDLDAVTLLRDFLDRPSKFFATLDEV